MLLATLLGLAVLPLLNGWLVTPPPGAACCSVKRWFSSEPLLRVASAVLHRVGISVAPRQVVVGRDGWLYLGDDQAVSLSTHRRAGQASDIRMGTSYGEGARRWDAYLRSRGVKAFRILVAADKESVYPEHLPQWASPPAVPGVADTLLAHADADLLEKKVMSADSNFFDVFSLPVLQGDASTALRLPQSVVLTATAARKYFPDTDPIGKTLDIAQNDQDLLVTAVCADVPVNSHLEFEFLVSSTSNEAPNETPNFINFSACTYLLLREGTDPEGLDKKIPELVIKYASGQVQQQFGVNYAEYQRQGNGYRYFLQPLHSIYLDSNLEPELKPPGSRERIYFFSIIAVLVLIIACVNFINLSTARLMSRSKEIGIRKTIGSERNQIIIQLLVEAVVISLVSATLAGAIGFLLLPAFNQLAGKSFTLYHLIQPAQVALLWGAGLVAGLLSGIYPALSLSLLTPIEVLRGKLTRGKQGVYIRNTLVVVQFAISIFLISCTLLVYRQLAYTQTKQLGFDKENLLTLQGAFNLTTSQTETFKQEIGRLPGVLAVGGCSSQPGQSFFGVSFKPNGALETTTGSGIIIDEGYVECMKMEVVQGRSFSPLFSDSTSLLINESAALELGLDDLR